MKYRKLVDLYEELSKTTKTLEKTHILAKFLKKVPWDDLGNIMYLLQGKVFPKYDERKIGFSRQLSLKAIERASGASAKEVISLWRKEGDLGKVAEKLIKDKKQRTLASKILGVRKVIENIRKLAGLTGVGTVNKKISLVAELLSHASPLEAKYIIRTVVEELRVGIAGGIIRDAIAEAFNVKKEDVQKAYNSLVDYAEVANLAKKKRLKTGKGKIGRPVKVMLAVLVGSVEEAFKALGKSCQFEVKLDGFRLQIHKIGKTISLFTRRMENVTKQFPDIVEKVKKHIKGDDFIIDTEAVVCKAGRYFPFQVISQRIKRKYHIPEIAKKYPIELNVFDVLYYKGKNLMNETLKKRRALLEKIVKQRKGEVVLTRKLVTSDKKKAERFFRECIKKGLEGVMIKNLNSSYKPGRYVGGWCKLKEVLEPLDLVIIGAEWGTGKRAGVLSSFVLACKSGNKFLECGKMGTGIKEKESEEGITFKELTRILSPLIIEEKGRKVKIKPKIVVEVDYEEIQKSPNYDSGFALRFPRLKRLRINEKTASQANTLRDLERIYKVQRGKK